VEVQTLRDVDQAVEKLRSDRWNLSAMQPSVAWWEAIARGLGHETIVCLVVDEQKRSKACLPLMLVQSRLFGRFLVSLPYLNSGGVLLRDQDKGYTDHDLVSALIDRAVELADELDVKYLELRHESRFEHPAFNYERTDKVHMRLKLPQSCDQLMASFKSKLRSQVKKASENPFEVRFGTQELLGDFYEVFAHNMRDLGTPVYSRNLFGQILRSFDQTGDGSKAELCVVKLNHRPISAGLLVHHANRTEVPSASALRKYNPTNVNMWMYWQLLTRAVEKGSEEFDFGRSTMGAGTYKFKEQWGAKPSPALWQYYVRKGDPAKMRPDSQGKQGLVKVWQKLPVRLTKIIGPRIVRGIP
jgi:FemAB-related protein (PEP-CTERM system-associated)